MPPRLVLAFSLVLLAATSQANPSASNVEVHKRAPHPDRANDVVRIWDCVFDYDGDIPEEGSLVHWYEGNPSQIIDGAASTSPSLVGMKGATWQHPISCVVEPRSSDGSMGDKAYASNFLTDDSGATYTWTEPAYRSCGCGEAHFIKRYPRCVRNNADEEPSTVDSSLCTAEMPHTVRFCEAVPCLAGSETEEHTGEVTRLDSLVLAGKQYTWLASSWPACPCGAASIQKREVLCHREHDKTSADWDMCPGSRPTTVRICEASVCTATELAQTMVEEQATSSQYQWRADPFPECNPCGKGHFKRRVVICEEVDGDSRLEVDNGLCVKASEPSTVRVCPATPCIAPEIQDNIPIASGIYAMATTGTTYEWVADAFEPCGCGLGHFKRRIVICESVNGDVRKRVTDAHCMSMGHPKTVRACWPRECVADEDEVVVSLEMMDEFKAFEAEEQESPAELQYEWSAPFFEPCPCGEGSFQRRTVECHKITGEKMEEVDDKFCFFAGTKPSTVNVCPKTACEKAKPAGAHMSASDFFAARAQYKWVADAFPECGCGLAHFKRRVVVCESLDEDGLPVEEVKWANCDEEERPSTVRVCPAQLCDFDEEEEDVSAVEQVEIAAAGGHTGINWEWVAPEFEACGCGQASFKRREVECQKWEDEEFYVVEDSECTEERPSTVRVCPAKECGSMSMAELAASVVEDSGPATYEWTADAFQHCGCGKGHFKRRLVICEKVFGDSRITAEESKCDENDRPSTVRVCPAKACDEDQVAEEVGAEEEEEVNEEIEALLENPGEVRYEWTAESFSDCQCGKASFLRRKVTCERWAGNDAVTVAESLCTEERPSTVRVCPLEPCDESDVADVERDDGIEYEWIAAAFEPCGCGRGHFKRRVVACEKKEGDSIEAAAESDCDPDHKPSTVRVCPASKCEDMADAVDVSEAEEEAVMAAAGVHLGTRLEWVAPAFEDCPCDHPAFLRRQLSCERWEGFLETVVDNAECDSLGDRPTTVRVCPGEPCEETTVEEEEEEIEDDGMHWHAEDFPDCGCGQAHFVRRGVTCHRVIDGVVEEIVGACRGEEPKRVQLCPAIDCETGLVEGEEEEAEAAEEVTPAAPKKSLAEMLAELNPDSKMFVTANVTAEEEQQEQEEEPEEEHIVYEWVATEFDGCKCSVGGHFVKRSVFCRIVGDVAQVDQEWGKCILAGTRPSTVQVCPPYDCEVDDEALTEEEAPRSVDDHTYDTDYVDWVVGDFKECGCGVAHFVYRNVACMQFTLAEEPHETSAKACPGFRPPSIKMCGARECDDNDTSGAVTKNLKYVAPAFEACGCGKGHFRRRVVTCVAEEVDGTEVVQPLVQCMTHAGDVPTTVRVCPKRDCADVPVDEKPLSDEDGEMEQEVPDQTSDKGEVQSFFAAHGLGTHEEGVQTFFGGLKYIWHVEDFPECACGESHFNLRKVQCREQVDGVYTVVGPDRCEGKKPTSVQICPTRSCDADEEAGTWNLIQEYEEQAKRDADYHWVIEKLPPCGNQCGGETTYLVDVVCAKKGTLPLLEVPEFLCYEIEDKPLRIVQCPPGEPCGQSSATAVF